MRWLRIEATIRQRVWWLYGWFCGLMCCGSCVGAVTWGAWMQVVIRICSGGPARSDGVGNKDFWSTKSQMSYWLIVFEICYAIEFFCLSVAKLMVLERMVDFFALPEPDGNQKGIWITGRRVVIWTVLTLNVAGMGGYIASAVFFKRAGDLATSVAAHLGANKTDAAQNFQENYYDTNRLAIKIASLQEFCEVTALLVIVFAFVVAGVACSRLLAPALLGKNGAHNPPRHLQLQIVSTTVVVFVTFLLRAIYSTMYALANALQNVVGSSDCPEFSGPCDSSCYNQYKLMQQWILFTPEYQLSVVLISSPVALIVALWGMTSERTLQLMRSRQQQMAHMLDYASTRS